MPDNLLERNSLVVTKRPSLLTRKKTFSRRWEIIYLYSSYVIEKIARRTHVALFLPKGKPSLDIPKVYISSLWIQQQIDALAHSGIVVGPFARQPSPLLARS